MTNGLAIAMSCTTAATPTITTMSPRVRDVDADTPARYSARPGPACSNPPAAPAS
ncbi:hypothetical protein LNQ52_19315 [Klebsiella pneumoniae subsp. pneumoniae]|nr:hypothetical protein [Klebsiella pneumoniae subsp. pneumoniae]